MIQESLSWDRKRNRLTKTVRTGTAEYPVAMKDGHPVVGKVTELHLAVQLRFLVRVPLPLGDKEQGAHLLDMLMENGLKPEWDRCQKSLEQLQLNLHKAAEMAVKTEYNARQAAGVKLKDGETP